MALLSTPRPLSHDPNCPEAADSGTVSGHPSPPFRAGTAVGVRGSNREWGEAAPKAPRDQQTQTHRHTHGSTKAHHQIQKQPKCPRTDRRAAWYRTGDWSESTGGRTPALHEENQLPSPGPHSVPQSFQERSLSSEPEASTKGGKQPNSSLGSSLPLKHWRLSTMECITTRKGGNLFFIAICGWAAESDREEGDAWGHPQLAPGNLELPLYRCCLSLLVPEGTSWG